MAEWLDVIQESELPEGSRRVFLLQETSILLFNIEKQYYAIHNQCTHAELPLEEGEIEKDIITCPYHGAKFCIKTGEVKGPPAFENLMTYPTRVKNGIIQIYLN